MPGAPSSFLFLISSTWHTLGTNVNVPYPFDSDPFQLTINMEKVWQLH